MKNGNMTKVFVYFEFFGMEKTRVVQSWKKNQNQSTQFIENHTYVWGYI